MKELTLNQKEQAKLQVLNNVLEHNLPMAQAAEILGVTERHAWRILAAYRREGAAALAHGNRGRQPPNAVSDDLAGAVVNLAATRYAGTNHTHFTDLLREREGIDLGRQTVRRILTKAGMSSPKRRRPPKHRVRRERMPQAGMLVQVDGSHHPWLEERGPRFALLLAVDDATGKVVNAVSRQAEDARGYFILMDGLIQRWGIPLALYTGRHGVFKFSGRPRHVPRHVESTQFSRSLRELGVQQIFAPLTPSQRPCGTRCWNLPRPARNRVTPGWRHHRRTGERGLGAIHPALQLQIRRPCGSARCSLPSRGSGHQPCRDTLLQAPPPRWPGTTPSSTTGAPFNCCPARTAPAMPELKWKSWNCPTAAYGYSRRVGPSPPGRRRRVRGQCGPPAGPWLPLLKSVGS